LAEISKLSGVAIADVAKVDAILKASIANINDLTIPSAAAFLLDTYTGAVAAYSVRRLLSGYTGACMRVREDSGDTETDIGFDSNGDLDTAAIATHCGSANGYVTKWYGQESSGGTGSGNDATQITSASQPQIYDGSAVITENGKPAIDFLLNDNRLFQTVTGLTFNTNDVGIFIVCTADTGHNAYATAVNIAPGASTEIAMAYRTEQISYTGTILGTGTSDTSQNLVSLYADNATNDVRGYIDGAQLGTTTTSSNAGTQLTIASLRGIGSAYWEGTIQEIVFYGSSTKSDHSGIEGNQNAHFQIGNFGTPTSGLLATYTGAAAAYSVRQLANTAALAMRIREDGTDTETDIGFDANGDLATADIAAFCGSNNGYVVTWYDQAGSQNDATQGTTTSQPQIYNGTAVITENGKPALKADSGSNNLGLETTLNPIDNQEAWFFGVLKVTGNSIPVATTNNKYFALSQSGGTGATQSGFTNLTYYSDGTALSSPTSGDMYDELTTQSLLTVDHEWDSTDETPFYEVGGYGFFSRNIFQEYIIWQTSQSTNRSGIETNINNYFSIY
jgi:hypothetical protein